VGKLDTTMTDLTTPALTAPDAAAAAAAAAPRVAAASREERAGWLEAVADALDAAAAELVPIAMTE
jgi:NADP-dependent aldehyde dehydrogenase